MASEKKTEIPGSYLKFGFIAKTQLWLMCDNMLCKEAIKTLKLSQTRLHHYREIVMGLPLIQNCGVLFLIHFIFVFVVNPILNASFNITIIPIGH